MPKKWKSQFVRVNLSSTFVTKSRCKECGGCPHEYYRIPQSPYYLDARGEQAIFDWIKTYIKRMSSDWYLLEQPRHFHSIRDFNFYYEEKAFKPALHQCFIDEAHTIEYLTCSCGRTVWAFNQKIGDDHPDIKHRKSRYQYPQKFAWY